MAFPSALQNSLSFSCSMPIKRNTEEYAFDCSCPRDGAVAVFGGINSDLGAEFRSILGIDRWLGRSRLCPSGRPARRIGRSLGFDRASVIHSGGVFGGQNRRGYPADVAASTTTALKGTTSKRGQTATHKLRALKCCWKPEQIYSIETPRQNAAPGRRAPARPKGGNLNRGLAASEHAIDVPVLITIVGLCRRGNSGRIQ